MEIFTAWTVFIHAVQEIDLKKHERVCNDHDYSQVEMQIH